MKVSAKQMALCGVLAALAVTAVTLSGMLPFAAYCGPVLASALLVPVLQLCGKRMAWAWYAAVAFVSILFCPDPEASVLFLLLGYYPIVKSSLDKIPYKALRILAKLLVFCAAMAIMYVVLIYLLGLEQVAQELETESPWILAAFGLLGLVTFAMTDVLLARLVVLFRRRTGGSIRKRKDEPQ